MVALCRQLDAELASHHRDVDGATRPVGSPEMDRNCDPAEVYRSEIALLDQLGEIELRIRIASYREILRDFFSESAYEAIRVLFIKDLATADKPALVGELAALCGRLYRRYSLVTAVERVRSRIAISVLSCAGALSLAFFACASLGLFEDIPNGYGIAMTFGAWGAGVSTIMRLYAVDIRTDPLINWLNLEKSGFSVWVAPILGATFAIVLALILHAGVIDVDFIPAFDKCWWKNFDFSADECVQQKLEKSFNEPYADFAKLAVWSFIAGWAERLVPDALNSLASRAAHAQGQK
jgi:hypothetical protein